MSWKTKTKNGECHVKRCKEPAVGFCEGHDVCAKHSQPDDTEAIVMAAQEEASELTQTLLDLEIRDQEMLDMVGNILVSVKTQWKDLEEKRTRITKPILAAKKAADDLFKPALDALRDAEKIIKQKIAAYMMAQQQIKNDALASGDHETAVALQPLQLSGGVSSVPIRQYRVVDIEIVPREWLAVDDMKIKFAMRENKMLAIPGIEFFEAQQIRVTT